MKSDIERRTEILSDIIKRTNKSKMDYAYEYGVAEITINRDLSYFRSLGLSVYSRNGIVLIEENFSKEILYNILSEYLPVKLNRSLYKDSIAVLRKSHKKFYFQNLVNLTKAISEKKKINFRYRKITDNKEVNYNASPISLVVSGYNWILHAVKDNEDIIKMFYVTRILSIDVLDEVVNSVHAIKTKKEKEKITLLFSKDVKNQLIDKIWFKEFEIREEENGNIILETEEVIGNSIASWCISWWDKIKIIEPISLIDYIKEMYSSFVSVNE